MEPVVDFGLFELLAASGLAWLARRIYLQPAFAISLLAVSLLAPLVLVIVSKEESGRWIAVVCLATSLVNAAMIFPLVRTRQLQALLVKLNSPSVVEE